MNIVVLDGYAANPGDISWEAVRALGDLTVHDRTSPGQVAARIGDAEIALTNKVPVTAEAMDQCPSLKYIGVLATGYNIVDTQAAKQRGIVVTNIPGYSTVDVAQLVFALLLEICYRTGHHSDEIHKGRWAASPDFSFWDYPLIELAGKTMGILGMGSIGEKVAGIAQAFGMHVLYHNRSRRPALETGTLSYATLDELFAASDVISLHAPLTDETRHIVNSDSIAKMKDGVIIINTSRGPLVNEEGLALALDSGKVYMAAVDVLEQEPPDSDNTLTNNSRTIITPHIGWATKEARVRLMDITARNIRCFLDGSPVNVVNL